MAQRGRKPADGRGRLGGRNEGTPNKNNPIKPILRDHSLQYFASDDPDQVSQFQADLAALTPRDRIDAELAILAYHTPKMQAVAVDLAAPETALTIEARLTQLLDPKPNTDQ